MIEPKTTLIIDGSRLSNFECVSLKQKINDHHTFEITVDDSIIESIGSHTLDKSKEWLGKPVVINFNEKEFLGVVTNVQLIHENGHNGQLLVSGYSKTILLEGGEHVHSWLEKDLSAIVNDSVSAAGVDAAVAPVFTNIIEYQAQYQETHFQFIKRLAKQYNEWFYYDGLKLIFGKPTPEAAIPVEYGADINSINISIEAKANSYNTFSYNALDDKKNESATKDAVDGLNELGSFAFDASKELFSIKPNGFSSARVKDKSEIDTMLKNKQGSAMAETNVLTATGHKQGLTVGSIIKVSSARYDNKIFDVKNYGEYIVTEITHDATGVGGYSNNFKAISSGVAILPEPKIALPHAHSQIATIVDNLDPKGFGRVKAKLLWQKHEQTTSWLRVMTPDAGTSDEHGEIRGNLVIPEINDQVMVGFRYGDPNRPFILGSLYNGGNITAGKENRNSLVSRMGSKMIMDDNDGSLQLTDKGGVDMRFDGRGNSNTYVYANNTMNTGAIHNVNVGAKKDTPPQAIFKMDKDGNILLESKTSITFKVGDNNITISEKGIVTTATKGKITVETFEGTLDMSSAGNMTISSDGDMQVSSSDTNIM